MTRDEAIVRLRKILRLAERAGSSEEAATAAQRAQEIMVQFGLSQAMAFELDADQAGPGTGQAETEAVEDFGRKGAYLDVMDTAVVTWRLRLASVVARGNASRVYTTRVETPGRPVVTQYKWGETKRTDRAVISIVGRPGDVETVRYLYEYVRRETERLCGEQGRGCGRTWANNFKVGVVEEVGRRLADAKRSAVEAVRQEVAGQVPPERALAVVNRGLERYARRGDETDAWVLKNLRLHARAATTSTYHGGARDAGRQAGAGIALGSRGGRLGAGRDRLGPGQ